MDEKERYITLKQNLHSVYEEREAANIATLVMEHITGNNRTDRLMTNHLLDESTLNRITMIEQRLLQQEPVQYVLGEVYFYNMKLAVNTNVLIPRPETEELVAWIIETVKAWPQQPDRQYKILDVGTGSGCIAIALQKNLPTCFEGWACDYSDEALSIARKNAEDQEVLVDFIQMDFLDQNQRRQLPHIDVLVSNPPYIPQVEKEKMHDNVVQYEPPEALFVPDDDPMLFYKALAAFGKENLQPGGLVFVEIHENYGTETNELFESAGYHEVELKNDLQGKHRMIKAKINK